HRSLMPVLLAPATAESYSGNQLEALCCVATIDASGLAQSGPYADELRCLLRVKFGPLALCLDSPQSLRKRTSGDRTAMSQKCRYCCRSRRRSDAVVLSGNAALSFSVTRPGA